MAEAAKAKATPDAPVNPKLAKPDPNIAPPAPPKELTAEEKKAEADRAAMEKDAQDKVAKINANLAKDNSPNKIGYQIRNGKIAYMWINEVPTRILTEAEMQAVEGIKVGEKEADKASAR